MLEAKNVSNVPVRRSPDSNDAERLLERGLTRKWLADMDFRQSLGHAYSRGFAITLAVTQSPRLMLL